MIARVMVALLFFFVTSIPAYAQEYTFGIVPQQSAKKLAQKWGPILRQLSDETGLTIRFATAKDIPTFEKRLAAGEYDFAYMNPYHFTVFNKSPGYIALAHQAKKSIQGIIVVRKDSEIMTLGDLADSRLAFPSPAAFAASILPQADLNNQGVSFEPLYVSSHDSVYLNVARGLTPAGGGVVRTFNNTDPSVSEQLRVLWKTRRYTPHAFAAHPDVAVADRTRLQSALINMEKNNEGMALLKSINFEGIESANDQKWDDVRALNITALSEAD